VTSPRVGGVYDLSFLRPGVAPVRVRVLGSDEGTPATPCGMPTVPIQILAGELPRNEPELVDGRLEPRKVMYGPGRVTAIAPFLAEWREVVEGGAA